MDIWIPRPAQGRQERPERPRHIPRSPTHPAVEYEEPVTRGPYGAWCGLALWSHEAVYDLVSASRPKPGEEAIPLCRACVQAATDALWARVRPARTEPCK